MSITELKLAEFNLKHNLQLTLEDYRNYNSKLEELVGVGASDAGNLAVASVLGDLFCTTPSYKGISRKILEFNTVLASDVNKYWKKSKDVRGYFMANNGQIRRIERKLTFYTPDVFPVTSDDVVIPIMDLAKTGIDLIADAKKEINEAMDRKEDSHLLSLLATAASSASHTGESSAANVYGLIDFIAQWTKLVDHIDKPAALVLHPSRLMDLLKWGDGTANGVFTPEVRASMLKKGVVSDELFVNFYTTRECAANKVYMLGPGEEVGFFLQEANWGKRRIPSVRNGLDQATSQPSFFVHGFEIIGMVVKNEYTVHEITVKS